MPRRRPPEEIASEPRVRFLSVGEKTVHADHRGSEVRPAARETTARGVKVGLCGFTVAIADYALSFPVVEVQQTFYEPPADVTMQRWLAATPRGFEFTMKAWQLVTHPANSPTYRRLKRGLAPGEASACGGFRDSAIVREALSRSLACARILAASGILFQCPASFRPEDANVERLRSFFTRIANPLRPPGVRYLWEPRGPAWTLRASLARELCNELNLVHVVDPFVTPPSGGGDAYYRLHGVTGARHVYSDAELRRLVEMTPHSAYVMFNNIPRASDAKRFLQLVRRRTARFPTPEAQVRADVDDEAGVREGRPR